jgi:ABC-2 type transport system ATP-binding protein
LSETCDELFLLSKGNIIKSVKKEEFDTLESEMKAVTIGNKIEKLGLV